MLSYFLVQNGVASRKQPFCQSQSYKMQFFYITESTKFTGDEKENDRFYAHCTLCKTDCALRVAGQMAVVCQRRLRPSFSLLAFAGHCQIKG